MDPGLSGPLPLWNQSSMSVRCVSVSYALREPGIIYQSRLEATGRMKLNRTPELNPHRCLSPNRQLLLTCNSSIWVLLVSSGVIRGNSLTLHYCGSVVLFGAWKSSHSILDVWNSFGRAELLLSLEKYLQNSI